MVRGMNVEAMAGDPLVAQGSMDPQVRSCCTAQPAAPPAAPPASTLDRQPYRLPHAAAGSGPCRELHAPRCRARACHGLPCLLLGWRGVGGRGACRGHCILQGRPLPPSLPPCVLAVWATPSAPLPPTAWKRPWAPQALRAAQEVLENPLAAEKYRDNAPLYAFLKAIVLGQRP